jgi:hypothetical protein
VRENAPSSPDERCGDEKPGGDDASSESETGPLSSDAAKLLEISRSETNAYDDCVEAVDVVELVRSRAERRRTRCGSSCHSELVLSTLAYSRP